MPYRVKYLIWVNNKPIKRLGRKKFRTYNSAVKWARKSRYSTWKIVEV